MVQTRSTSLSPAWSLAAGWTEPVASSQGLGQLQLDHSWLQEEHTTLQQERNDLVAERDRLREERDGLLGERDASAESKLDKLYAALQYTLGLVYTVLMSDVTMCKLILAKLTPQAEAASVVVLGGGLGVSGHTPRVVPAAARPLNRRIDRHALLRLPSRWSLQHYAVR